MNIADLFLIILGIIILIFTYIMENLNDESNLAFKYFQVILLGLAYFRAFTYLRIFKYFRNVIHMLIAITITSTSFLLIIASFVIAMAVIFVKANVENDTLGGLLVPEFDSM